MSSEPEDVPETASGVVIPAGSLSEAALGALIESFVNREGTDYGARERSLAEKVAAVRRQLERGEARIEFDPETESVNIVQAAPRRAQRGEAERSRTVASAFEDTSTIAFPRRR